MFAKSFATKVSRVDQALRADCTGELQADKAFRTLQEAVDKALKRGRATAVELHFGQVQRISSLVIRMLDDYIGSLAGHGMEVTLHDCPGHFVAAVASSLAFAVRIRSVDVPLICHPCGNETTLALGVDSELVMRATQPVPCQRCGQIMELDCLIEFYQALESAAALAHTQVVGKADTSDPEDLIGTEIPGQYLLESLLGEGGTGRVYLADQLSMDRRAAIKVVTTGPGSLEAYLRTEAKAISRLSHPNIVTVFNFGELDRSRVFLAMEYVEGQTLRQMLESVKQLALPVAAEVGRQCASALAYASANGVTHRDLKPENIMIAMPDGRPRVKILDFGLAMVVEDAKGQREQVVGTTAYMSPEVWLRQEATHLSDQYSLGLLLYEAISGRRAFVGPTLLDFKAQHLHGALASPSAIRLEAACHLFDPIIARMIMKDPGERYPDMDAVEAELAELSTQLGAMVGPAGASDPRDNRPSSVPAVLLDNAIAPDSELARAVRDHGIELRDLVGEELDKGTPLLLLAGGEEATTAGWRRWGTTLNRRRSLISSAVTATCAAGMQLMRLHPNLVLGVQRPEVIAAALRLLRNRGASPFDYLTRRTSQVLSLSASIYKEDLIECLGENLRSGGLREKIAKHVASLCDELVMNALYHAPRTPQGVPLYRHVDRSVAITMPEGRAPCVRWSLEDDFVALSVRDSFGSLTLEGLRTVIARLTSPQPTPVKQAFGMGMGLPLSIRASRVCVIRVVENEYTEIVCLLDRRRSFLTDEERTTCVLFEQAQPELVATSDRQLGPKLFLRVGADARGPIISLSGQIDENCDLRPLFAKSAIRVSLAGITRINSSGVLRWMNAREQRPEVRLRFHDCSVAIISTLATLAEFIWKSELQSLILPAYCETCAFERPQVLDVVGHANLGDLDFGACPSCRRALVADFSPETILGLLGRG